MVSSKKRRLPVPKDLISNVPGIVTDIILEHLPIKMAAMTSVLSKHWRCNWLSLRRVVFDDEFCKEQTDVNGNCNWQECSNIISSILLHHKGPIHEFNIQIPEEANVDCINVSHWLSFLSDKAVRRITLCNLFDIDHVYIPSYLFCCSELEQLELDAFTLNPPPTSFSGFMKLQQLVLLHINFTQPGIFHNVMAKCRKLVTLRLEHWSGMVHVVIDVPSLETLTVKGQFESLTFGDVHSLKNISVCLVEKPEKMSFKTINAINLLASSCQLQSINFIGHLCRYLTAGKSWGPVPVTFNYLKKLCLSDLDFGDVHVVRFTFAMVVNCPLIEELRISIVSVKVTISENEIQHSYNKRHKLDHLLKVKIKGIVGSSVELKLIEYLLAISSVLEEMTVECGYLDTASELKMSKMLMRFPRASAEAHLFCL